MGQPARNSGISQAQRRLLRGAINRLGLNEYYYDILKSQAGVTSSKDLTQDGFRAVMAYLETQGFKKTRGYTAYLAKWQAQGDRPGRATSKELAMIEYLWDQVGCFWNKDGKGKRRAALRGFLKNRVKVNDLRFLDPKQAYGCIEALKAIRARQE